MKDQEVRDQEINNQKIKDQKIKNSENHGLEKSKSVDEGVAIQKLRSTDSENGKKNSRLGITILKIAKAEDEDVKWFKHGVRNAKASFIISFY